MQLTSALILPKLKNKQIYRPIKPQVTFFDYQNLFYLPGRKPLLLIFPARFPFQFSGQFYAPPVYAELAHFFEQGGRFEVQYRGGIFLVAMGQAQAGAQNMFFDIVHESLKGNFLEVQVDGKVGVDQ